MKPAFLLLTNLFLSVFSWCQDEPMSMKIQDNVPAKISMNKENSITGNMSMEMRVEGADKMRLPFYTKIGNRVIYHLYISDTTVNYTGKTRHALAINGSVPAPTLIFTEGDTAEIYVHNTMMMETSIHCMD